MDVVWKLNVIWAVLSTLPSSAVQKQLDQGEPVISSQVQEVSGGYGVVFTRSSALKYQHVTNNKCGEVSGGGGEAGELPLIVENTH